MIVFLATLRSLLMMFVYPVVVLAMCVVCLIEVNLLNNRFIEDRMVQYWGYLSLYLFGIRVEEKGRENLKWGSCLYLFNHTSFFDVFVMHAKLRGLRFGAKIELFSIPVFGRVMRKIGVLPIARDRREEVIKVYQDAQKRAAKGEQFALSPEGGRNTEEKLLPFKSGPFIFAIEAGIPLVPVIIRGAQAAMPKKSFIPNCDQLRRVITIEYLPRIEVSDYKLEQRHELQDHVYEIMNQKLNS